MKVSIRKINTFNIKMCLNCCMTSDTLVKIFRKYYLSSLLNTASCFIRMSLNFCYRFSESTLRWLPSIPCELRPHGPDCRSTLDQRECCSFRRRPYQRDFNGSWDRSCLCAFLIDFFGCAGRWVFEMLYWLAKSYDANWCEQLCFLKKFSFINILKMWYF